MIQKNIIDAIYRKFNKLPASPDELNLPLLFEQLPAEAKIDIDGKNIIINSVGQSSPFHIIPINHIHSILEFDKVVAIVLHSSILFFSKDDGSIYVHLKAVGATILDRMKSLIAIP